MTQGPPFPPREGQENAPHTNGDVPDAMDSEAFTFYKNQLCKYLCDSLLQRRGDGTRRKR